MRAIETIVKEGQVAAVKVGDRFKDRDKRVGSRTLQVLGIQGDRALLAQVNRFTNQPMTSRAAETRISIKRLLTPRVFWRLGPEEC